MVGETINRIRIGISCEDQNEIRRRAVEMGLQAIVFTSDTGHELALGIMVTGADEAVEKVVGIPKLKVPGK